MMQEYLALRLDEEKQMRNLVEQITQGHQDTQEAKMRLQEYKRQIGMYTCTACKIVTSGKVGHRLTSCFYLCPITSCICASLQVYKLWPWKRRFTRFLVFIGIQVADNSSKRATI